MDLSSKYIKMCAKAQEIQESWKPAVGDFLWLGEKYICDPEACRVLNIDPLKFDKRGKVWLPRQDQLQGLLYPKPDNPVSLHAYCSLLVEFLERFREKINPTSYEQLWLAFVMWDRYNKIWDEKREEWVEIAEESDEGV